MSFLRSVCVVPLPNLPSPRLHIFSTPPQLAWYCNKIHVQIKITEINRQDMTSMATIHRQTDRQAGRQAGRQKYVLSAVVVLLLTCISDTTIYKTGSSGYTRGQQLNTGRPDKLAQVFDAVDICHFSSCHVAF